MLPATIPLFPLPNVVLFPNVCLPLHIFEPRYREMVADALDGDRIIGMVLLRPGWEGEYEGRPPIYDVGCAGLITHAERHRRWPLQHRAARPAEVQGAGGRSRRAAIASRRSIPSSNRSPKTTARSITAERRRLEAMLVPQPSGRGVDPKMPPSMPDEELVNALAQYLDLEVVEKQALLERDGLVQRCRSLIELLEMKVIVSRHNWWAGNC